MRVQINGEDHDLAPGTTLSDLLDRLGLVLGSVVVEHNGVALLRGEAQVARLSEGDVVELVKAVAGG